MNLSQQRLGFHKTIKIRILAFNMRCDQLSLNTVDEYWMNYGRGPRGKWKSSIPAGKFNSYLSCSRQPGYFFHVPGIGKTQFFLVQMFP